MRKSVEDSIQKYMNQILVASDPMPQEMIRSLIILKKVSAIANSFCCVLNEKIKSAILLACDILLKDLDLIQVPLWQSGSGTQSHMVINDLIAKKATEILSGYIVHPNDHMNMSQSTNDVFPSAMRIAVYFKIKDEALPACEFLEKTLLDLSKSFQETIKIGRTHLMDAVPMTLSQELMAFAKEIQIRIVSLKSSIKELQELPLGGTAVGTGLNTPKGYKKALQKAIDELLKEESFSIMENSFHGISIDAVFVKVSSEFKALATTLIKLAKDLSFLSSGPLCGINEITLPNNTIGSSIMAGKVNPIYCEMLKMMMLDITVSDIAITQAASMGQLQLNTMRPLTIYHMLRIVSLFSSSVNLFVSKCLKNLKPNTELMKQNAEKSLMLATALNSFLGYDSVKEVVRKAKEENITIFEATLQLNLLPEEDLKKLLALENFF